MTLPYSTHHSCFSSLAPKDIWQWLETYLVVTTSIWCIQVKVATKHPPQHSVAHTLLPLKRNKNFPPQVFITAEAEKPCSLLYYRSFHSHVIFPLSAYLSLKSLIPLAYPTIHLFIPLPKPLLRHCGGYKDTENRMSDIWFLIARTYLTANWRMTWLSEKDERPIKTFLWVMITGHLLCTLLITLILSSLGWMPFCLVEVWF